MMRVWIRKMEQVLVKNAMREKQMSHIRAPVLVATERRRRLRLILQEAIYFSRGLARCPGPRGGQRIAYFRWYRDRITPPLLENVFFVRFFTYFFECSYYSEPKGGDRVSAATVHKT